MSHKLFPRFHSDSIYFLGSIFFGISAGVTPSYAQNVRAQPLTQLHSIQNRPSNPTKLTIAPQLPKEVPATLTYFFISQSPQGLMLNFGTKDPQLTLNTRESLAIQMATDPPFQVEPHILLKSDWPTNATRRPISVRGAVKGPNRIVGVASYHYCHTQTKVCKEARSDFTYSYHKP
mgnify:CR=1 FL=1